MDDTKQEEKPRTRTTIYLPSELHTELRIAAIRKRSTMNGLVTQAIKRELDRLARENV